MGFLDELNEELNGELNENFKTNSDRIKLTLGILGISASCLVLSKLNGAIGPILGIAGGKALRNWAEDNLESFLPDSKIKSIWKSNNIEQSFSTWAIDFVNVNETALRKAILNPIMMSRFLNNYKLPGDYNEV